MNAGKDWQGEFDRANDVHQLRAILAELEEAIAVLEDSSFSEEEPVASELHTLEILRDFGEQKLARMLA